MAPASLRIIGGVAVAAAVLGLVFVWSFRTKADPVQTAVRRMNRRFINPRQLRTAGQPGAYASVVRHVGRTSGANYATPVVAMPDDDGFVIALPYGPRTDWVRNVMAAGSATIDHEGRTVRVEHPELVAAADANPVFGIQEQRTHRLFKTTDFLRLRGAPEASGS